MNYKAEIEKLKSELENLLPMSDAQREALQKKIRLEFNFNTNHIEGNTLTYGETKLLLLFDETRGNHLSREYEEMKGSDVALELIQDLAENKEKDLTESFIRSLNKTLLVKPYWKEAITEDGQQTRRKILVGDYKQQPNNVQLANGEMFGFASVIDTPILMAELIEWLRDEEKKKELPPAELAAELHYRFVRIHPFDDGNGRISRLLMNYILLKNDYPPVIIKSEDKKNYLSALRDADTGNFSSFVNYIEEQLIWSLELYLKAAKGESLEEEEDWKKRLSLINKQLANNETILVEKSHQIIIEVINEKIIPSLISLINSLSEFEKLFLKIILSLPPIPDDGSIVRVSRLNLTENKYIQENAIKAYIYNLLKLEILFVDFNKLINNQFTLSYKIQFDFERLKYTVQLNEKEKLTKLYHQDFTQEEIHLIKNAIGKYVTEEIGKHLSNKP